MSRKLVAAFAVAGLLMAAVSPAAAEPDPVVAVTEYEAEVAAIKAQIAAADAQPPDPSTLATYETAPAGELLASPAVVTEEELRSVGTTAVPTSAAGPTDFVVDGPPTIDCPEATFTSIQAAVTAAPPGSVIKVCPGSYAESVVIPKTLTLFAPRHQGQATQCPADEATDPTQYAVVMGTLTFTFDLRAPGILLEGFVVQGPRFSGIRVSAPAAAYIVRNNIIQGNSLGVFDQFSGSTDALIEHNCFRENTTTGIFLLPSIRATIQENFFTQNPNRAMFLQLVQETAVTHNEIVGGFAAIGGNVFTNTTISYNHVREAGDAISLFAASDSEISFNLLEGPGFTGLDVFGGTRPFRGTVIEKNHARGFSQFGIDTFDVFLSTIAGNKLEQNGDGIRMRRSSQNTVSNNLSRDNTRDGIRMDGPPFQASLNTIELNTFLGNGEHDCHDDSVGPGTAGTANFWIKNVGKTENRPGICVGPTP